MSSREFICPMCRGSGFKVNEDSNSALGGSFLFEGNDGAFYRKTCISCEGTGTLKCVNGFPVSRKCDMLTAPTAESVAAALSALAIGAEVTVVVSAREQAPKPASAELALGLDPEPLPEPGEGPEIPKPPLVRTKKSASKRPPRRTTRTVAAGERFGHRVIMEDEWTDEKNQRFVKCRCDCGHVGDVSVYALMRGRNTECRSCAAKRVHPFR